MVGEGNPREEKIETKNSLQIAIFYWPPQGVSWTWPFSPVEPAYIAQDPTKTPPSCSAFFDQH